MLKALVVILSIGSLLLALGINLQIYKKKTVVLVRNSSTLYSKNRLLKVAIFVLKENSLKRGFK